LVPPNNPIKLAEAIQYLLDNKDVRAKLGQEGRKIVEENYSSSLIANKLRRIYEEMLM
jgi:glycosyltransferase involved in cell wall biosynthesis